VPGPWAWTSVAERKKRQRSRCRGAFFKKGSLKMTHWPGGDSYLDTFRARNQKRNETCEEGQARGAEDRSTYHRGHIRRANATIGGGPTSLGIVAPLGTRENAGGQRYFAFGSARSDSAGTWSSR
jgi:hypothetical protein